MAIATTTTADEEDMISCPMWSLFLAELRTESSPLLASVLVCLGFALVCWIVSSATDRYAQVDKLWSITPVLYAWILVTGAAAAGVGTTATHPPRPLLMALVVTVWGVRLTYNFARRGGYAWPRIWEGLEDHRWQWIRDGNLLSVLQHPIAWHVFNCIFISIYQHVLLWLLVVPPMMVVHIVGTAEACGGPNENSRGLQTFDYMFWMACLASVGIEAIADDQQYAFQTQKYALLQRIQGKQDTKKPRLTGDYHDGFLQSGLFSVLRKPNYAAEQFFWCAFAGWSIVGAVSTVGWRLSQDHFFAATGSVLLVLLFQLSGPITETISCKKYPRYAGYKRRVPLYVPWRFWLLWGNGGNRREHDD